MRSSAACVVGFEAQHDDRRRVRRPREPEAVGVLDAQAVDADDVAAPGKSRVAASLSISACGDASAHAMLSSGVLTLSGSACSTADGSALARQDLEQARARVQAVVESVPALA